jgi:hypothetical protein
MKYCRWTDFVEKGLKIRNRFEEGGGGSADGRENGRAEDHRMSLMGGEKPL